MTENEFLLSDRISKIKSINELYDLENNAVLSFSGGKDSIVLHYLLDEALPGNKIPRLFLNFEKWFIREKLNYVNYIILHIILKELVVKVVLLR